jgi:16S rRNA C967 or C1407 C5-methylase (RsmB/RsmF family)/NOL1/NOP2/fmu family ribosome biogenesis protein
LASPFSPALLATLPTQLELDMDAFVHSQYEEPITSVRVNPRKYTDQFEAEAKVPWCEKGYYLNARPNFTADPLLHAGAYYVQEASSMFLEVALRQTLDLNQPIIALDLCAAPGGKSTLIASLLNDESLLISNEVIHTRASILCENSMKWGQLNMWVSNSDPKQFGHLHHSFDLMVIDAPCSGSGLFRKIPDYLDEWTMDNVHLCAQRQKRILRDSYDALAQDGVLVYMTCSFSEQENESIVDYILQEFDVDSCQLSIPSSWGIVETQSELKQGFGYRFFPHKVKGEGFFLACFRKKDGMSRATLLPKATDSKKNMVFELFVDTANKHFMANKDQFIMLHEAHLPWFQLFSKEIKLIKKGILVGKLIRDELIPDHELALYNAVCYAQRVEVNLSQAIQFLKKDNLELEFPSKGWFLVTYLEKPLGWVKNLGNRMNNYYPSNHRILSKNILPS